MGKETQRQRAIGSPPSLGAYSGIRSILPNLTKPQGKPKAFSYLRFSTPEQQEGDSIRRQIADTEAFARELGLELDSELRFEDRGVSAFRGRNAAEGALAEFLENVEAGKVPQGSYLVVEALDRVSRDNAWDATEVLNSILRRGINVAVTSLKRVYSREELRKNPFLAMEITMHFQTANRESENKSYRSIENWKAKRATAAARGEVMTSRGPAWLTYNAEARTWEPIPERMAIVQRIFRDFLAGVGAYSIARSLNQEGIPTWGKTRKGETGEHWQQSYIKRILYTPITMGTIEPSTWEETEDGRKVQRMLEPIPNYYPAVIDPETWKAQALRTGFRVPRRSADGADLGNLFSHLLKCAKCGHTASVVIKNSSKRTGYVVCNRARLKAGCEWHSLPYANLEESFRHQADALLGLYPSGHSGAELDAEINNIDTALEVIPEQLERLTKLYRVTGTQSVADELLKLDAEREELEARRNALAWKASEVTGPVVENRVEALRAALAAEQVDRRHVNACLRLLFSAVEVDAEHGIARFHWKHGGSSEIIVAMPDAAEARRRNLVKARAAQAATGYQAVIAHLAKVRAAQAAKREAAKAAEVEQAAEVATTEAA